MELQDLFEFAKKEHDRQVTHHKVKGDPKVKYTMFAKLIEELGELSEAMTTADGLQRGDKLRKAKSELADEFADVLLVTLILAEEWNVDAKKALIEKIEKIKKRNYK
ncbi:hypothetical protein KY310_04720 [Candidatus Woesearchaeota archaeon]|nr:hypothetical protein [Candidatus Woesearchaeota archaeon]